MHPTPIVYEINTRSWLHELERTEGRPVFLDTVPEEQFKKWKRAGFTHIWLMGIWETGPMAALHARQCWELWWKQEHPAEFINSVRTDHIQGSPYAIAAYTPAARFGKGAALKRFRARLHEHGLKLLLDFVPNHLGVDHGWIHRFPSRFVQLPSSSETSIEVRSGTKSVWLANGRDPHFPPWSDTVQVNIFSPETREELKAELEEVASFCDGVRCDMSMLLLNDVFAKTWGNFLDHWRMPKREFWEETIPRIKEKFPDFLFIAEVYWGLEQRMQELGFDYTYFKEPYDCLVARDYARYAALLDRTPLPQLSKSVHFLENHDEKRSSAIFNFQEHQKNAGLLLALPGMKLIHEGQLEGRRQFARIQLVPRPEEQVDNQVAFMYDALLELRTKTLIGRGRCEVLQVRSTLHSCVGLLWTKENEPFVDLVLSTENNPGIIEIPMPVAGQISAITQLTGDEPVQFDSIHGEPPILRLDSEPLKTSFYRIFLGALPQRKNVQNSS